MKTFFHVEPCDDQRLRVLLRGDEESAEFASAASHVEVCEHCQGRLSELAAAADEWAETRQLLNLGEGDASFASECRDCRWNVTASGPATTCAAGMPGWTEAMAKQFLAPPSHPEMLGRLGRYEIERLIGSGGMGVVFKGFDTELNRPVAIKVLAPHLAGHGAARQRFAREARAAAAVVHEHVVSIHNVESDGTAPFLVMKFVAGESLQARIDRQGPFDVCEILRIAKQTAAGLAAAHAQGLVHRDVKPANILLEQGVERALLTDFGLARASDDASLTHTGYMPGTPHYMSPEQSRGESVDARSDLFSLGSVMYTMCTGRPPFRAETSFGILRRITDNDPRPIREVNSAIPEWLAAIITKLHAKSPADRFASAAQLATLLEACLAHVQQPTVVPLPAECRVDVRPTRSSRTRRFILWSTGLVGFLILGAVMVEKFDLFKHPIPSNAIPANNEQVAPETERNASAFDPATDWDEVGREIHDLIGDSDPFETRARQLWDILPQPVVDTDTNIPSNADQPAPQETQK